MKKQLSIAFVCAALAACQSLEVPKPAESASGSPAEVGEPKLFHYPGVEKCIGLDKTQMEAVYAGRWREKNESLALPHTLIVMRPIGGSSQIFYATGVWKQWGLEAPNCSLHTATRNGNSLSVPNLFANTSVTYELNGQYATGAFSRGDNVWPITMSRVWPKAVASSSN